LAGSEGLFGSDTVLFGRKSLESSHTTRAAWRRPDATLQKDVRRARLGARCWLPDHCVCNQVHVPLGDRLGNVPDQLIDPRLTAINRTVEDDLERRLWLGCRGRRYRSRRAGADAIPLLLIIETSLSIHCPAGWVWDVLLVSLLPSVYLASPFLQADSAPNGLRPSAGPASPALVPAPIKREPGGRTAAHPNNIF
jgi:hypothetical protein